MTEQLLECFRDLPDYLGGHMLLSVTALAVGIAVSIPLGIAASRRPRLAELTLGAAGVIQTVPSLALLVLMVPLLGTTGFAPAFLALILYSILPIVANTVIGIRGVDPVLIEAARGLGMSELQMLRRVQLPLAAPVIIGGVRTATVLVVGTATLVTPVAGKSLGNYIFGGLETLNYVATVFGCVFAALLAIMMDQLVRLFELAALRRSRRFAWMGAAGLLLMLGGGLYGPIGKLFTPAPKVVASAPFTEQYIWSEVLKKALEADFTVEQRKGMSEGVQFLALRNNQIDCCVNYVGNIWAVLMRRRGTANAETVFEEVTAYLRDECNGVECLGKLGFENAYALAMRPDRAKELLGPDRKQWTVSRLAQKVETLRIAADLQFFRRPEWRDLEKAYGQDQQDGHGPRLRFREIKEGDATLMYGAVKNGEVDVIVAYTSDGRIDAYGLELLQDDLAVLPPYDAILLVSAKAAANPEFIRALSPLVQKGGAISTATMRKFNGQVDMGKKSPRLVGEDLAGHIMAGKGK